MENKNSQIMLGIILGIVIVIAGLLIFNMSKTTTQILNNPSNRNTVSVSGTSNLDAMPDQAVLYLRIEYINNDPKIAQDGLTSISNKVISALKQNGLSNDQIETINYNLEKYYDYSTGRYNGYIASHTLKLTIKDLSKAGDYINLAVNNGVNKIDSLQFSLSKEKEKEVRTSLLSAATQDARDKADLLAGSLNARVKSVISVSESSPYNYPVYYAEAAMLKADSSPVIQPKSVSTTVTVNVIFEIE